ncbi:MAG: exodeoxyribonuclease VII large subunit [Deltaproteobacteria bacterium]|nr:exodeoxyribonuclease VII large subunit [Deltaproteobacteria bacterium]
MKTVYSVTELTTRIKDLLEENFRRVWVEGEINNFKHHSSGHMYFSLQDEKSSIRAVIYRTTAQRIGFLPKNGMKVVAMGNIGVYPPRGEYQLIVGYIEPEGLGAKQLAFEELKKELEKKGYFEHKKPIPPFPKKIIVVTSPTGAAVRDIVNIISRRARGVELYIYPVQVQGETAKYEIIQALSKINTGFIDADVVILSRGGGSWEDLWTFNEREIAEAIHACRYPLISAIGHEIDFTIADFVADLRAPTPSAAAELVVKNRFELLEKIDLIRDSIKNNALKMFEMRKREYDLTWGEKNILRFVSSLQDRMRKVDDLEEKIIREINIVYERKREKLKGLKEKLCALNPASILRRGYSITYDESGRIIKTVKSIIPESTLKTQLQDGVVKSRVEKIFLQ